MTCQHCYSTQGHSLLHYLLFLPQHTSKTSIFLVLQIWAGEDSISLLLYVRGRNTFAVLILGPATDQFAELIALVCAPPEASWPQYLGGSTFDTLFR